MDNAFSLFATAFRALFYALCYCGLEFINLAAFGTDACVGRHNLCARGDQKVGAETFSILNSRTPIDPVALAAAPTRIRMVKEVVPEISF